MSKRLNFWVLLLKKILFALSAKTHNAQWSKHVIKQFFNARASNLFQFFVNFMLLYIGVIRQLFERIPDYFTYVFLL